MIIRCSLYDLTFRFTPVHVGMVYTRSGLKQNDQLETSMISFNVSIRNDLEDLKYGLPYARNGTHSTDSNVELLSHSREGTFEVQTSSETNLLVLWQFPI